jgi:hypothetical protein
MKSGTSQKYETARRRHSPFVAAGEASRRLQPRLTPSSEEQRWFLPVGNGEALARAPPRARLLVLEQAASAIPESAAAQVAAAMLEC